MKIIICSINAVMDEFIGCGTANKETRLTETQKKINANKGVTHAYVLNECICSISHFGGQILHQLSFNMKPFKNSYVRICGFKGLLAVKVKITPNFTRFLNSRISLNKYLY